MPSFRQIQYFLTVADSGSIRKAADRLDVTQPTLSAQLSKLESTLGVSLFERTRASTHLTASGRQLLPVARQLINHYHEFEELAHTLSDDTSTVQRLGVPPTLGPYLLPTIVPALHRRYARLKLYVREDVPNKLESGLRDGSYDFTLNPLPLASTDLAQEVLFREPLVLVAPTEMIPEHTKIVDEAFLAGKDILSLDERHHYHQEILAICERSNARLNRDYEGTSLDTLRQMVVTGMGLAFLPALYVKSEIHRTDELRMIQFAGRAAYREHALLYRSTSPSRQLYRDIADLIRKTVATELEGAAIPVERQ